MRLFNEKQDCCGCMACMNICPKQAIIIRPDEDGFTFPEIKNELCVECGMCKNVCVFQNPSLTEREPIVTYVAINKNTDMILNSASGGIFGAFASLIFEKKGVVFGCAYNDNMEPEHICVDNQFDMKRIQGSKYVQSNINTTYQEAQKYLHDGRCVLFTGTPCQIAGLKSYLDKEYSNLITADIICHGTPSSGFFKGYIRHLEKKIQGRVIDFKFRDKSKGWGHMGKVIFKKKGKVLEKIITPQASSYYNYFMNGFICRESCYECKYACGNRAGDFTMGDYWGIEKAHPEIGIKNGVSVLLVNSKKGMSLVDEISKYLTLTKSTFEQASEQNKQLSKPIAKSDKRDVILNTWREGGYKSVADGFYKANQIPIIISKFKLLIPNSIKRSMKRIIKRRY